MKRQFLILIAIAAFVSALSTNAFGQRGTIVQANIKFDFHIGERMYPAGEYRIESMSRPSDNILLIRSLGDANRGGFFMVNYSVGGKGQTPILVFQTYGGNYFLTKIFLDTDGWGYSVRPSRRLREREKNLALASLKTIEVNLTKEEGNKK